MSEVGFDSCNGAMPSPTVFLLLLASAAPGTEIAHARDTGWRTVQLEARSCGWVTKLEAELELGRRLEAGADEQEGGESSCTYAAGDGKEAMVRISSQQLPAGVDPAHELAVLKAGFPDAAICPIPGLGRWAVLMQIPGAGAQAHVVSESGKYLLVSVLGFGDGARVTAAAEALARKAASRL